jgi:CxxC-x17-CxxC domain-containing protein
MVEVTCSECGRPASVPFEPTAGRPVYCNDCFSKRRPSRGGGGGGGGGFRDRGDRQMFDVTCSDCGKQTQVPFQPSGDRPVYCQDCFRKRKPARY